MVLMRTVTIIFFVGSFQTELEMEMNVLFNKSEDDIKKDKEECQQQALTMCKHLIEAKVEMGKLVKAFREEGIAQVDLHLRNALRTRMADQSNNIEAVQQMVKTTKLTVLFCTDKLTDNSLTSLIKQARAEQSQNSRSEH